MIRRIVVWLLLALFIVAPTQAQRRDPSISGTFDDGADTLQLGTVGVGTVGLQLTGTLDGLLVVDSTIDGTNWEAADVRVFPSGIPGTLSANGIYWVNTAGTRAVRVSVDTYTSGSGVVTLWGSVGIGLGRAWSLNGATDGVAPYGENGNQPVWCDATAFLDISSATTTLFIAGSGSEQIHICGLNVHMDNGAAAQTVKLISGTGATCGTGTTTISPTWLGATAAGGDTRVALNPGGGGLWFHVTPGDSVCVVTGAANMTNIIATYSRF